MPMMPVMIMVPMTPMPIMVPMPLVGAHACTLWGFSCTLGVQGHPWALMHVRRVAFCVLLVCRAAHGR